jgi:hypothetical protein
VSVRGQDADVNVTFGDLFEGTDSMFGICGRAEIGRGKWAGFVETMYQTLNADDETGPLGVADIDVGVDQLMVDFGLMYRLGQWTPSGRSVTDPRDRSITLDLYGGGRYNHLELDVDPATLAGREHTEDWIDPIVGAKFVLPFADRWRLALNADVGGFGLQSDFTWSATGVVGYEFPLFSSTAIIYGGYRAISWDFTDGSGTDEFTFDVISHGPIFGFALTY